MHLVTREKVKNEPYSSYGNNSFQFLKTFDFLFDVDPKPKFWVAGGSLLSAASNEYVNDFDIFTNPETNPESIINYFKGNSEDGSPRFVSIETTFENDFVINLLVRPQKYNRPRKIQIIKKYRYDSPEECIINFDFTCIAAAYDGNFLYCHDRFFADALQKRLVINSLPKPLSTMKRIVKYAGRGFVPCPVGLAKVAKAINEMDIDWDNPDQNDFEFYPDGTPMFRGLD